MKLKPGKFPRIPIINKNSVTFSPFRIRIPAPTLSLRFGITFKFVLRDFHHLEFSVIKEFLKFDVE